MKRLLSFFAVLSLLCVLPFSAFAQTYTYMGKFAVEDGPYWGNNPRVYSAREAAALFFGGNPTDYAISTNGTSPSQVNRRAFVDGYGDTQYFTNPAPEDFKRGNFYNESPGVGGSTYSAFVLDHGGAKHYNHVFRIGTVQQRQYTYVGRYNVHAGPLYSDNPRCYSAKEAAALKFGGDASDYAISTNGIDPAQVNNRAFVDGWGDASFLVTPVHEDFKKGNTYAETGQYFSTYSAYVRDHYGSGDHFNYVFRIKRPVLLVHGVFSSEKKAWGFAHDPNLLRQRLAGSNLIVEAVNFQTEPETMSNEASIPVQARALGRRIEELRIRTGQQKVNLVCHSMGGLAARWYLHHPDLWSTQNGVRSSGVSKLIMLGTPNWGTDIELQNPILGVAAGRMGDSDDLLNIPSDFRNTDTHEQWSPALNDMFAEWQPAPQRTANGYTYPVDFKLSKWSSWRGAFTSPIGDYTYTVAGAARKLLRGVDQEALDKVQDAFAYFNLRQRTRQHIDYYTNMASEQKLGKVMYQPIPGVLQWGVNARRISQFLYDLNIDSHDDSGAKIYIIAGLENRVVIQFVPDMRPGPYSIPSDAFVPCLSVLGIDPISGADLFPNAKKEWYTGKFTNHTDLTKYPDAVDKVLSWLDE